MQKFILSFTLLIVLAGCKKDDNKTPDTSMYFPSDPHNAWETTSISALNWNPDAIQPLLNFLEDKNTKSFMILVNGRIVLEEYFNGHTAATTWEWNSAGKTLVGAITGIAQQEQLLDIDTMVSSYLGTEWTSMPVEKENLITSRHLLTMTSGIDDTKQLVIKSNLTYLADAGSRWAYGNVFQRLINVVEEASGQGFDSYFNAKLRNKIGMDGVWNYGTIFTIYHSTTRSMALFGLLALNKGKWKDEQIINETFFTESTNSSQAINPSYGYFWWLNGKEKYMLPGGQVVYNGPLVPNAPSDMFAAMGARDQRIYVIPGENMVVVRMGEPSDPDNPVFAVSGFDNDLWEKINDVIN